MNNLQYQKAFTILELIVVFFFFAMLSGLALPNLTKAYSSWQRGLIIEDLVLTINNLSLTAITNRQIIVLTNTREITDLPFALPEGWQLIVEQPIYYFPNGICSGGSITLKKGNFEKHYDLQAPYCIPEKI